MTLVTASVFGQEEEEEKKKGRALSSSTTVAYTLTVTPKMVQSSTPAAAYVSVSQALQQSVQPPAPGGSDSFTLMLVQLARTASNTGVTSKSVAGSLQISAYNSLSPTIQPTSTAGRVSSSTGSSSGGGISEGTQVGIAFGVIGVVLVMVVAYFAYTRVHKDNIPERDVSMAAMQRNNEPFDSEQEQTVSPLPPAAAGGHHRKQSLIDIIPAAQFNPLATPGTDPNKRL